ncbi:MAG: FecR family protein [Spirochaetes bacterium]|nr:FecR family protein [Spirochaetota bacterium]
MTAIRPRKPVIWRDILVTLATIAAAAWFIGLLYTDLNRSSGDSSQQAIGILVTRTRVAQRRPGDSVVWTNLKNEEPVYSMDAIRTEQGSEAIIRLNDDTQLILGENSLVVLDFSGTQGTIDFLEGSLIARRTDEQSTGKSLNIRADGNTLAVQTAVVDLNRSESKNIEVNVSSGQAVLSAGGESTSLTNSESALIQSGQTSIKTAALIVTRPLNGDAVSAGTVLVPVSFAWNDSGGQPPYTIEIARDRDFSLRRVTETDANTLTLELDSGTWYWRVQDSAAGSSRTSQFTVISDIAPLLLSPTDGGNQSYRNSTPALNFSWAGISMASSYEYQLSADAQFSTILREGRITSTAIALTGLPPGSFYWRVAARYDFGGINRGRFSEPRSFTLVQTQAPASPALESPPENFPVLSTESSKLIFSWSVIPETESYELALWQAVAGNSPPAQALWQGKANVYRPQNSIAEGSYYWSIRSIAADGTASAWAAPRRLLVEAASQPQPVAPLDAYEILSSASTLIQLSWRGYPEAVIIVGRDTDMAAPISSTNGSANRATIQLPGPGLYYWTAVDPRMENTDSQKLRSILVISPPAAPELLQPAQGRQLELAPDDNLDFSWTSAGGAAAYKFSLRNNETRQLVHQTETTETRLRLSAGIIPSGSYTWTVQSVVTTPAGNKHVSPEARSDLRINTIRVPPAPAILAPRPGTQLEGLTAARSGLTLSWSASEPGMTYLVKIWRADGTVMLEQSTKSTEVRLANPGPGVYRWSLGGAAADGASLAIQENSFQINLIPALPTPTVQTPRNAETLDLTNADFIKFGWAAVTDANAYEISLSSSTGSKLIFSRIVETGLEFLFRELDQLDIGQYSFRIRALLLNRDGTIERSGSLRSVTFSITIKTGGAPVLTTPKEIYVETP